MRIQDIILNFRRSDMYDADKRKRVEQTIEDLNTVLLHTSDYLSDGNNFDDPWCNKICSEALISRGIQKLDEYDRDFQQWVELHDGNN